MMAIKEVERTSIMEKVESKTLKQREASEIWGLSLRHTQRLIHAYRDEGPNGLISKKRGKPNPRRVSLMTSNWRPEGKRNVFELRHVEY